MRRLVMLVATATTAASLGACGGTDVVVMGRLANQNSSGGVDTVAVADLPVRLLPFDRDEVFDSLTKAAPEPEPPVPDSLLQLQQQIATAQDAYQSYETAWADARDSLQSLSQRMQRTSRASGEYTVLYREFGDLESKEKAARQQMDQAFQKFTSLQSRFAEQSQEIRAQRQTWADNAYASVDSVFGAKYDALGLEELADTTSAAGVAVFHPKKGKWWVYARYSLPYSELYWNVPIEVTGDSIRVILSRENAQTRPRL